MALNIIDFSNGIRPEEIQDNFEYLQEQISRERASVGGSGVASGLEITVNINENVFEIILSDGTLIDDNGEEIFIKGKTIEIEPPILYQYKETLNLSKDKTIRLKHTPYGLNRRVPAEFLSSYEPEVSGITIKHKGSIYLDDYIRVRNINDRELTVTGALMNELDVTYRYTAKRIDALYIDENLEIKIKEGTTSTTPSAIMPLDAKFLLAYLEIDNEYTTENDLIPHAYIYIKDDLRTIRNLYTTSDGTLYICGIPFDDLQIIHLIEPKDPKPNTLWLNTADNTLYCWRSTDEFIYKNKIDITTDFLEEDNADMVFSTYMDFLIGGEELDVYLNDVLLVKDIDYEEIAHDLPTFMGNEGSSISGNTFRILQTINRADGFDDVLVDGDVITYLIRYKDSQYMWIPLNKMNYLTAKNTQVYSTYYEGINPDYIYEYEGQTQKAYFDSKLANSLDKHRKEKETDDDYYPYKYQYFFFRRTKDLNMHFTPYRKELSIMINQMYLHEDQFKEITVFDILTGEIDGVKIPDSVIKAVKTSEDDYGFGWSDEYIKEDRFNGDFDNSGIGFVLIDPLDSGINAEESGVSWSNPQGSNDLFVEAIVERRVCTIPVDRKLQRGATFIHEDSFVVESNFNSIVEFDREIYRYNEHQLEVFVDGLKQVEGKDYIEEYGFFKENKKEVSDDDIIIEPIRIYNTETKEYELPKDYTKDQSYFLRKKAAVCNKFQMLKDNLTGSVISYKITTNVYSYDHINNILDDIGEVIENCEEITSSAMQRMNNVEDKVDAMNDRVRALEEEKDIEDPRYLTTDSILNIAQMPNVIVSNAIKSLEQINIRIDLKANQTMYSLNNINGSLESIWADDYINIFYHNILNNMDSYWVPGLHYEIKEEVLVDTKQTITYLNIKNVEKINNNDVLYITGIKLSNHRPIGGGSDE